MPSTALELASQGQECPLNPDSECPGVLLHLRHGSGREKGIHDTANKQPPLLGRCTNVPCALLLLDRTEAPGFVRILATRLAAVSSLLSVKSHPPPRVCVTALIHTGTVGRRLPDEDRRGPEELMAIRSINNHPLSPPPMMDASENIPFLRRSVAAAKALRAAIADDSVAKGILSRRRGRHIRNRHCPVASPLPSSDNNNK